MANRLHYPGYKLNNYNSSHSERGYYTWAYNERYRVFCTSWLDREPVNFTSSVFVRGQVKFSYTPRTLLPEQYHAMQKVVEKAQHRIV